MKEVCSNTGLTERAVRLYVERELVHPARTWRNGRDYLEFSEADLRRLEHIAALRRCDFILDEIAALQNEPERLTDVLSQHAAALRAEVDERAAMLALTESACGERFDDWEALACRLARGYERLEHPAPVTKPDFGRLDADTPTERETGARSWHGDRRRDRLVWRLRLLCIAVAICALLAAGCAAVWNRYRDDNTGYTLLTSLHDVVITAKGVDTSGQGGMLWLDATLPDETAWSVGADSIRLLTDGDAGSLLWDSVVFDHAYPMLRIRVFLSRRLLRELELGDSPDAAYVLRRVLSDQELTSECVRLISIQGEYG